jgi:EAL domain-containing protein (putative c-di-GMP-specific phosphodiesterase class I)
VARLVQATCGAQTLLAHGSADEFLALLTTPAEQAQTLARRLLSAVESLRVVWEGATLHTTASIGLVCSLPPHAQFDELLSRVDAACHEAKDLGGNRVLLVAQDADTLRTRQRMMRSALDAREALEQRRIEPWCQPIVPLLDTSSADHHRHFEVLLRWRDSSGQLHPPAQLVAAAERFRLGPRLDRYVVNATLAWLRAHPEVLPRIGVCSINLGGATLVDDEFSDYLADRLNRNPLRAGQLCFEITETNVVRDMARARQFIQRMRALGCHFALDDFGTGFCSFGYLRDLQVDYLKIDGSFVHDLERSPLSQSVVRSITDIAHLLGMRAIAEHAETQSQVEQLRALGVDYAQGYVFQKPQPIAEFFGLHD